MPKRQARTAEILTAAGRFLWKLIRHLLFPLALFLARRLLLAIGLLGRKLLDRYLPPLLNAIRERYRRIPKKRLAAVILIPAILLGIVASLLSPGMMPAWRELTASKEEKRIQALADRLVRGEWEAQKQAAGDALGQAGIVLAEQGSMPPAGSPFVIAPELTLLAYDAGRKPGGGHLNLNELALMLRDLGFPFAEDKDPALLLQSGIRKWVIAALENPDREGAAAPLFLYAMAKEQLPAIDLTADDWDPSQYRLTYLELQVFTGAFFQAVPTEPRTAGLLDWFAGSPAYAEEAPGACSAAKEWFNRWGAEHDSADMAKFGNEIFNVFFAEVTGYAVDLLGKVVKTAMSSISIMLKIAKLAMLYWSVEVNVEASRFETHKPNRSEAGKDIVFKAVAGVNEQKYQEYVNQWNASPLAKEIKECLSLAGLPSPTDTGDLAADVENWDAEWDLMEGGAHVGISDRNRFELPGQFQLPFVRSGPAKGEAPFIVDVLQERAEKHEGQSRIALITPRVLVETSAPPLLGTLVNGGKIGMDIAERDAAGKALLGILSIPDTLLDVIAGWFQEMAEPEAYGYAVVTYHDPGTSDYLYEGWARAVQIVETETTEPYYDGFYEGTIKSGSSLSSNGLWQVYARATASPAKDAWSIFSIGEIAGYARTSFEKNGSRTCIGPGTVTEEERSSGSGSSRIAHESSGSLNRSGTEEDGFTFNVTFHGGRSDVSAELNRTVLYSPSGCEFVLPSFDTETQTRSFSGTLDSGTFTMQSKEPFPKVLAGSGSVKNDAGVVTRWSWSLKRVDPVSGAKSASPAGG